MTTHRDLNTDTDLQAWIGKQVEVDFFYIRPGLRFFGTITGYYHGQWYATGYMGPGKASQKERLLMPFYTFSIADLES